MLSQKQQLLRGYETRGKGRCKCWKITDHAPTLCRKVYPAVPRYVLWIMMEIAIIGSDIQEVLLLPLLQEPFTHPPFVHMASPSSQTPQPVSLEDGVHHQPLERTTAGP